MAARKKKSLWQVSQVVYVHVRADGPEEARAARQSKLKT
jgi:hypothetical protein